MKEQDRETMPTGAFDRELEEADKQIREAVEQAITEGNEGSVPPELLPLPDSHRALQELREMDDG